MMKLFHLALLTFLGLFLAACNPGAATPAQLPSVVPSYESSTRPAQANWRSYYDQNGAYTIQYPGDLTLFKNERPSIDGVVALAENTISLQGEDFLLVITFFDLNGASALGDFVDSYSECFEVSGTSGRPTMIGSLEARIYPDTLCGLNGITYLYTIQGTKGYRFTIETAASWEAIRTDLQPILDSFASTALS